RATPRSPGAASNTLDHGSGSGSFTRSAATLAAQKCASLGNTYFHHHCTSPATQSPSFIALSLSQPRTESGCVPHLNAINLEGTAPWSPVVDNDEIGRNRPVGADPELFPLADLGAQRGGPGGATLQLQLDLPLSDAYPSRKHTPRVARRELL